VSKKGRAAKIDVDSAELWWIDDKVTFVGFRPAQLSQPIRKVGRSGLRLCAESATRFLAKRGDIAAVAYDRNRGARFSSGLSLSRAA